MQRPGQAHYPAADRGQMSDHTGARMLLEKLPTGSILIGDRGYDSDDFRTALNARGIKAGIPPTKNRRQPIDYDKALYKWRHKVENLFASLGSGLIDYR